MCKNPLVCSRERVFCMIRAREPWSFFDPSASPQPRTGSFCGPTTPPTAPTQPPDRACGCGARSSAAASRRSGVASRRRSAWSAPRLPVLRVRQSVNFVVAVSARQSPKKKYFSHLTCALVTHAPQIHLYQILSREARVRIQIYFFAFW